MNFYEIRIQTEDGTTISRGQTSAGNNAIEAFENAIEAGVITPPTGELFKVLMINTSNDIAIEFKAGVPI